MRNELGKSYLDTRATKQQESRGGRSDLETANMRFFRRVESPGDSGNPSADKQQSLGDLSQHSQPETFLETVDRLRENLTLPKTVTKYLRLGMYITIAM